jgi:tRNA (cytidine/uridine-2'-O-)-methyltransferase
LRRAGLDYWPFLDLEIHNNLEELLDLFGDKKSQVAFLSKRGPRPYTEIPPSVDLLVFGRETSGLPEELHHKYADSFYHIPMFHPGVRSLNLANTVSVVVYSHIHRRQEAALL